MFENSYKRYTGAKIHILSKNSHFQNLIFHKIHHFKILIFTKFTFSKSQFSQNSHSKNPVFHKIHNFKVSLYSQNSHFSTSNSWWFLDKMLVFTPVCSWMYCGSILQRHAHFLFQVSIKVWDPVIFHSLFIRRSPIDHKKNFWYKKTHGILPNDQLRIVTLEK